MCWQRTERQGIKSECDALAAIIIEVCPSIKAGTVNNAVVSINLIYWACARIFAYYKPVAGDYTGSIQKPIFKILEKKICKADASERAICRARVRRGTEEGICSNRNR